LRADIGRASEIEIEGSIVLGLRATKGVFGARMAELRQARG